MTFRGARYIDWPGIKNGESWVSPPSLPPPPPIPIPSTPLKNHCAWNCSQQAREHVRLPVPSGAPRPSHIYYMWVSVYDAYVHDVARKTAPPPPEHRRKPRWRWACFVCVRPAEFDRYWWWWWWLQNNDEKTSKAAFENDDDTLPAREWR